MEKELEEGFEAELEIMIAGTRRFFATSPPKGVLSTYLKKPIIAEKDTLQKHFVYFYATSQDFKPKPLSLQGHYLMLRLACYLLQQVILY